MALNHILWARALRSMSAFPEGTSHLGLRSIQLIIITSFIHRRVLASSQTCQSSSADYSNRLCIYNEAVDGIEVSTTLAVCIVDPAYFPGQ